MLESYKGKKVKILVSSNSGSGTSISGVSCMAVLSSVITVFGELTKYDDKFVEISNARTIYMDGFQTGYSSYNGTKEISPAVLDNPTLLININNIITVSIIG